MTTIKSYTDLDQSKKLAEILPLESADMYYFLDPTPVGNIYIPSFLIIEKHLKSRMPEYDKGDIPCWSLASLGNILPRLDCRTSVMSKTFDGKYRVLYHSTAYEKAIITRDYDNLIDACYEMILKLHELNLL